MKIKMSRIKTRKFGNRRSLHLSFAFGFPIGVLLSAAYLLLSHSGHAEGVGSTSGERIYSSGRDRQELVYSTGKLSSSGTLLLSLEPFSQARTTPDAIMETVPSIAPADTLSGHPPLSIDTDSIHRARPFFESPAILCLIVLFILSINIDSLAKQERLLDFFALSFVSAAQVLKQMAPTKRRWKWTLRQYPGNNRHGTLPLQ